ncbi:hypothetical protein BKA64DRAFT_700316 [Cadophora sp. MPI-SDFR-AT-0126]|nr:hypothetical protein BKA64DRAFT_700316 [Leotiomycetes sp. MPI-SDFR-AT-0126]
MASHEVVTTLVSALHSNIDSIHATLQSLSHPTHEAELQRLASEREAKIFDLRTAHAQALQVLANQRLKEQDELEAKRQREVEEIEEQRKKEWEEVLKRRAKEDEERRERIRVEELERERIKLEEDECREAQREERELKLAEDIEKELERVENEIEAKVELGKKALRELDEKRRAINAEIDKALNMPTVFPKIPYRSRTRTLSRAGTMEQTSSPHNQSIGSVNPAANEQIQTPEPGAWLGQGFAKEENDGVKELVDSPGTINPDRSFPSSKEVQAPSTEERTLGKTAQDPNLEMPLQAKDDHHAPNSSVHDVRPHVFRDTSPNEVNNDCEVRRGLPVNASVDGTIANSESYSAAAQPQTEERSFEDMYLELQIKNLDTLSPESEPETQAIGRNEQSVYQDRETDEDSLTVDESHLDGNPAFVDSGIDLSNDDARSLDPSDFTTDQLDSHDQIDEVLGFAPQSDNKHTLPSSLETLDFDEYRSSPLLKGTPESGSAFQSTQMTPVASSDDLIKNELESQRTMLPVNDAPEDQMDAQLFSRGFESEAIHDPMADLLWGRVPPAAEAPKRQQTSVTELSVERANDPMADKLWGRSPFSTYALQSGKTAPLATRAFSEKVIFDPMSDILWGRAQMPLSGASVALDDQQAPIAHGSRDRADPMFDFLWGRSQIARSGTSDALKVQSPLVDNVSREVIYDPMSDVLWGRSRVSQTVATKVLSVQQTPIKSVSSEVIYDPMSDVLWGRKPVSGALKAAKSRQAHVPEATSRVIYDPMSDRLWGRSRKTLSNPQEALKNNQTPSIQEIIHDPMADILWGRSRMSQHVSPDAPKQQQAPVAKKVNLDRMFDILWGRNNASQLRSPAATEQTPEAIKYIHDPMSDILWGRNPVSLPAVYEIRESSAPLSHTSTEMASRGPKHQEAPVTEPRRDPMSDFLWGRNQPLPDRNLESQRLNTLSTTTKAALQDELKPHEATGLRESQINAFEEQTVQDLARSHEGPSADTGTWPLATKRDLIIDHGEDSLSTTSVEESQSIVGQAISSQLDTDEVRDSFSPESSFSHPGSHDSSPLSSQANGFNDTSTERRQYPPTRHHEGEPWPLRDGDHHIPMSHDVAYDQGDHNGSDDGSEGSDNWSESDEEDGSEPEQRFGSLRPHQVHRMTNDDEYLPRSARNIAATDSEEDMSFEEKYGVPRTTSPIRSLSSIDSYSDLPHRGPDAGELFGDDDSEEESSLEHGQRASYPEDMADQYFQRADTPLEVVPEHAPLTEFNDTYAAHRSSGLFANIVEVVRSDVPAVRQVQLDNYQPGAEYVLGNAARPRAVSFEDDEPEFVRVSASPYESSLHVRTHTADTLPSFDSYAQSDSIPTTPSETSSSPVIDHPHDEPIIRDSGRERGMTETSQSAQDLSLETPKAAAFDPALANAYPSFMSPKPSYADLRDNGRNPADIERMNAGYGSFGAQTGLEAHRARISPVNDIKPNPFTNGIDTSQTPKMASNNPFKTPPMDTSSPGYGSVGTPNAGISFQGTRSLPRTPPRLSISPQSSASPTLPKRSPSSSPGLSRRPPPPVPTGSPGSLFAKTRSVFESASPQGSPALTPSPITALSAIRHSSPPMPPPPRRSVGSRPSSLYISEPVQYSPPAGEDQEPSKAPEQQEEPGEEEVFMPRNLDGNNKPPSPVFIPSRSDSISSLRKEEEEPLVKKRSSNPFLGGLSRLVGGIQSGGLDDSVHNPAKEPLLKHGEEH